MRSKKVDGLFLFATILLVTAGFFIFLSASLGLLVREGGSFSNVAIKQFLIGFVGGGISLIVGAKIPYLFWRKLALPLLLAGIILCILVFVPGIGFEHGGAKRWLNLGPLTFQPAELLKLGMVVYFAAWIAGVKEGMKTWNKGALPFLVLLGISGVLLLKQPDTGTFMVVAAALVAMFVSGKGKWRYVIAIIIIGFAGIMYLAETRPYVKSRIMTFIDPSRDPLNSGYQVQQSMIAIGSGQILGRGFGQSVQKFNFLPEPIGDSIFAVAGEEFGFFGTFTIIFLFMFFALRGYKLATHSSDIFGGMLTVGIVTLIVSQALINIGSMVGVLPLTGVPLSFISHGGSALFFALIEVGIVLNISKSRK